MENDGFPWPQVSLSFGSPPPLSDYGDERELERSSRPPFNPRELDDIETRLLTMITTFEQGMATIQQAIEQGQESLVALRRIRDQHELFPDMPTTTTLTTGTTTVLEKVEFDAGKVADQLFCGTLTVLVDGEQREYPCQRKVYNEGYHMLLSMAFSKKLRTQGTSYFCSVKWSNVLKIVLIRRGTDSGNCNFFVRSSGWTFHDPR